MEQSVRGKERHLPANLLHSNLPYDESLELPDCEDLPSVISPAPSAPCQSLSNRKFRGRGLMSANSSSEEFDEEQKPEKVKGDVGGQPGVSPNEEEEDEEEEDEEEESDEDESDEEDDDDETGSAPEGAYDPADYANLPVSTEVKELFQYITRYTPQSVELEHSLKPFIPDFIPAVGDIDAFLKVPRPDAQSDGLGLQVLDEPSVKQSDPTLLHLWFSEDTKTHTAAELMKVSSVVLSGSSARAVDSWVDSISALHGAKPAASVQYARLMPHMDTLLQEWPPELEELLTRVRLPPAHLTCDLGQYVDLVCSLLDIPVYCNRIHSLHLLFNLYLEFRDSQHFTHT